MVCSIQYTYWLYTVALSIHLWPNYFRNVHFNRERWKFCETIFTNIYVIRIRLTIWKITEIIAFIPLNGPNLIILFLSYHYRRWRRVLFISRKFHFQVNHSFSIIIRVYAVHLLLHKFFRKTRSLIKVSHSELDFHFRLVQVRTHLFVAHHIRFKQRTMYNYYEW